MKKVIKNSIFLFVLMLSAIAIPSGVNASCDNEPGGNDGDCVEDRYGTDFCDNSWAWHDCVQGGAQQVDKN